MTCRVFINGLGRIGRTVLRAWAKGAAPDIQIVGLNDIASADICAHLFEFDSIFGPYPGDVSLGQGALQIDGQAIPLHTVPDISGLDLTGVDVVMECTGTANTRDVASRGLQAGARRVLISGPSDSAEVTVVIGANDDLLHDQQIVSNASCTTNALAPLVKLLDDTWGLQTGWMTTIHCYTTSLPQLAGRVEGAAVRVPVASVSAVDLTVTLDQQVSLGTVKEVLAAQSGIIGSTDKHLVSTDLRARPESLVVALPETRVTKGELVRIFGWYDNEWGFSNRMLEMASRMGG